MKKTYMIPTLQVVKIQTANLLQTVSMFNENATSSGMGRQAGFSDDDDWSE